MQEISISADELIKSLLNLEKERNLCLLDSCGISHLGSHLMIAGFDPIEIGEINETDPEKALELLDKKLAEPDLTAIFTLSYEFGAKLNKIRPRQKEFTAFPEPDIFLALFDCLVIHDYTMGKTFLTGNQKKFDEMESTLLTSPDFPDFPDFPDSKISSNFTRASYMSAVEKIREFIRNGDTYQTNLTQQLRAELPENLTPEQIFLHLRQNHPAPFASFIRRKDNVVISASPERFFKVTGRKSENAGPAFPFPAEEPLKTTITVSPIKGTRPRGVNKLEDDRLKDELLNSEKERAENIMIVDLLRNDLGRVCKFGSVRVEKLCDLETHPTLFHLVSTVNGELNENTKFSDIIRATYPCGSITGAPKIRTMQIIDQLETAPRGLSMGAIGYSTNNLDSEPKTKAQKPKTEYNCDLSVAIRTMVIRNNEAIFNVGGGIVIDSNPENEYEETLTKAKALLKSINANIQKLDKNQIFR